VTKHLERLFARHGKSTFMRADNGREFIAVTVLEWLSEQRG
jgi:putative transposase